MSLGAKYAWQTRAELIGAIVLMLRSAQYQGGEPLFIAGALALAEWQAVSIKLDWLNMLDETRNLLGEKPKGLLDTALRIKVGERAADEVR